MPLIQTKPKKIYKGTTEIKSIYLGDTKIWPEYPTESIVIVMKVYSNGNLLIPVSGFNAVGNWASYNWKVSYDGGTETTYSGTSASGGTITLATGLTTGSEYTVIIKPVTESYGWARAFAFNNGTIAPYLKSIIYDGSYMGYATSAVATGNYFRYRQYFGCTSITKCPDENLPNTVTSIGTNFRTAQFYGCTSITESPEEVLPNTVTTISLGFRANQFYGCTALTKVNGWKDLSIGGSNYRSYQYYNTGNKTVKVISDVGYASADDNALPAASVAQVQVPSAYLNNFKNTSNRPRVNISDSLFVGY